MSAGASIAWNGIVVEVLNRENYSNWSALMKNYLMGKDLWDNIINDNDYEEDEKNGPNIINDNHDEEDEKNESKETKKKREWELKNRRALHAIQVSCGKALGQIRKLETAQEAWDHLKTSFRDEVKAYRISLQKRYVGEDIILQTLVRKGFLGDAKFRINTCPNEVFFRSPDEGRTVLHVAMAEGHVDIVNKLVKMGKKRLLKMQDKKGYTALALAAKLTDNRNMVECMVMIGGEELLTIAAKSDDKGVEDEIPVPLASAKGHRQMTRYLFRNTPFSVLRQKGWQCRVVLLSRCIHNEIFDVAALIIQDPDARLLPLNHSKQELRPIYALAHMPSAFPTTGTKLKWWKWTNRFIYNILSVEDLNNESIEIVFHKPDEIERPYITTTRTLPGLGRFFRRFQRLVQSSILLKFDVFRKIYEKKMEHYYVLEILKCLCKRMPTIPEAYLRVMSAYDAMLLAAKNGINEFIKSMRDANPELLLAMEGTRRGVFAHAIVNRQEEVFQLIHEIDTEATKEMITSRQDAFGNNLLHIAAELGPSRYLDSISNPALQMQRELHWFGEVTKVVPWWCHEAKNIYGEKPREVFSDNHKELLKSSQQWTKETTSSFIVVGTVIITIMFAAAFTVPGGNNANNGESLLGKQTFTFFIVSVALSLVTSSSSVLIIFFGILTSRHAEEDFNTSLPIKLLFGLVTLFLSVLSMMCAFCAALALMLKGYPRIVIAALWLVALLPIIMIAPWLLRLTSEFFQSLTSSLRRRTRNRSHI